ncbi:hypothetical protein [Arenimonas composti]|uniref:Uncharacterized protein n=1 Tax=Arenimonas composti TR7-09 = DSM 18010 TaxID=1121013 RepID=A0A091BCV9_9GAMM|nr:hypothetical protein [Arenimonas composti]KFN48669.1 hypothetical protein P873_13940 [Arenimonas composti TR7-09 = DSM 18010]
MAKPNYSFEKRQRELAKQKKKAEKEAEKALRKRANAGAPDAPPADADLLENTDPGDPAPTG